MKKNKGFQYILLAILLVAAGWVVYDTVAKKQEQKAAQEKIEKLKSIKEKVANAEDTEMMNNDKMEAPNFSAKNLAGQEVDLADYRGKKVILNFWASWCPPCKAEMPHMNKYQEGYAEVQNAEILAVNLTSQDNGIADIQQFVEDYEMKFEVLLDDIGLIAPQYGIMTIPTTFILDEDGFISSEIKGPVTEDLLLKLVEKAGN